MRAAWVITALVGSLLCFTLYAARPRVRHIRKRDYPDDYLFI
jgi:hypothetical protein